VHPVGFIYKIIQRCTVNETLKIILWGCRFSQQCCSRFGSPKMWCCVIGQMVPIAWRESSAFILNGQAVPEDLNPR